MHEVVAGADGTSTGQGAEEWAAQRADRLGLLLHLVRAVPEPSYYRTPVLYGEAVAGAQTLLGLEGGRVAGRHPKLQIATSWQPGEPAQVLSGLSGGAEMVVLGSDRLADRRGEGFGSVSFQAAVLCRSPVAVIPAPGAGSRTGEMVGLDGSRDSAIALRMAAEEANRMGESLKILHAVSKRLLPADAGGRTGSGHSREPNPQALLSEAAGTIREHLPALTVYEALESDGPPADVLIRAAGQASLLVIGCLGAGRPSETYRIHGRKGSDAIAQSHHHHPSGIPAAPVTTAHRHLGTGVLCHGALGTKQYPPLPDGRPAGSRG